jgi:hypothetical protein
MITHVSLSPVGTVMFEVFGSSFIAKRDRLVYIKCPGWLLIEKNQRTVFPLENPCARPSQLSKTLQPSPFSCKISLPTASALSPVVTRLLVQTHPLCSAFELLRSTSLLTAGEEISAIVAKKYFKRMCFHVFAVPLEVFPVAECRTGAESTFHDSSVNSAQVRLERLSMRTAPRARGGPCIPCWVVLGSGRGPSLSPPVFRLSTS